MCKGLAPQDYVPIVVALSVVCSRSFVSTEDHRKQFDHDSKGSFSLQSYSWTLHRGAHPNTASNGTSSRLKEALLQSVVQMR